MNIFRILSSNDGSINEPNVSSFLAYLLNPRCVGSHDLAPAILLKERISVLKSPDFLLQFG